MKDDAPAPERIPTKRRQIEDAPAHWLREWLGKEDITFREKKRIEKEIQRRKDLLPDVKIGIVVGKEGVTPAQLRSIDDYLQLIGPTEILHAGVSSRLHQVCRRIGVPVTVIQHPRESPQAEVVKRSTTVVAAVKEPYTPEQKFGVWGLVKYAKHRKVPVRVYTPDGKEVK